MSKKITGHCLCGATSYSVDGPAKFSIVCYCTDCQRATGGGHAPLLGAASEAMTITGPLKSYAAKSDSGNDLAFQFCSECGSPVAKTTSMAPGTVFLYAGALDDPADFPDPTRVFEDSRQPWDL